MGFYARPSLQLARQVAGDVGLVIWVAAWFAVGRITDWVVRGIAEPARQVARLGGDVRHHVTEAATQAAGIPLVGDGLRRPLDQLAGSVDSMTTQAQAQVAAIESAATVMGLVVWLIPALVLAAVWLPRRFAFARLSRDTSALLRTTEGSDLLALRALATQPLAELKAVASDPVAAWRSGDQHAIAQLAELELVRAGVARPRRRTPR